MEIEPKLREKLDRANQALPEAGTMTKLFPATASKEVRCLETNGIVRELTGRRRNRVFAYSRYIRVLQKGTETT